MRSSVLSARLQFVLTDVSRFAASWHIKPQSSVTQDVHVCSHLAWTQHLLGGCCRYELPEVKRVSILLQPARLLILFSGGLDSTLLAALAHNCLPANEPIDLVNVCFDDGKSPDRLSSLDALEELAAFAPERRWRLIKVRATLAMVDAAKGRCGAASRQFHNDIAVQLTFVTEAQCNPESSLPQLHRRQQCPGALCLALACSSCLFCRLLALLHPSHSIMDLNIGAALWLAAHADGTLHLPQRHRCQACSDTVPVRNAHQCHTNADARSTDCEGGSGQVACGTCGHGERFVSRARVAFLGHGADEVFCGYGRHRTAFKHGGLRGAQAELELDMRRLWTRNLGRDDRIVADCAREARHPFLDEELLRAIVKLPLATVADLSQKVGTGDKKVLRGAARLLGLERAAARAKRAIQFGSRIGKLSNVRDFGSNRAANHCKAGSMALQDV